MLIVLRMSAMSGQPLIQAASAWLCSVTKREKTELAMAGKKICIHSSSNKQSCDENRDNDVLINFTVCATMSQYLWHKKVYLNWHNMMQKQQSDKRHVCTYNFHVLLFYDMYFMLDWDNYLN